MEKNFNRRVTFCGTLYRRLWTNAPISKKNLSSRIRSWSEKSPWRLYYRLSHVFIEHIRTHILHKTILDVFALPELRSRAGEPIHVNNVSVGVLY